MRRSETFAKFLLHGVALTIAVARADVAVFVDPAVEVGPIKAMNAVNNGPTKARADQSRGNFADFQALRIPYALRQKGRDLLYKLYCICLIGLVAG